MRSQTTVENCKSPGALWRHLSLKCLQLIQSRRQACDMEPDLSHFRYYVDKLAESDGMSGDETDHCGIRPIRGQRKFFVIRPEWRSKDVTKWLRAIDKVYVYHRFSKDGRASRGNWVRQRIDSGRLDSTRRAVPGLPKNFYDATWLESLSNAARVELRIQPEISLRYSPTVKKYSFLIFECSGITLYSRIVSRYLREEEIPLEGSSH
jgi:hypothetical protein